MWAPQGNASFSADLKRLAELIGQEVLGTLVIVLYNLFDCVKAEINDARHGKLRLPASAYCSGYL